MDHPETPNMPRERRSLSFDPQLLEKIDKHVEEKYEYKDRSHFFEVLARRYFEKLDK